MNRPPDIAAGHGAPDRAIRAHYDAGNAFFAAWLDREMVYSAARWPGAATLEEAQLAKLDWHLDAARVGPDTRLMDVGCGWGALMARAAGQRRARQAVGLTPSEAQADWIADHVDLPGISVIRGRWQDVTAPGPFDAIVSIGALEHFARPGLTPDGKRRAYAAFFEFCAERVQADGRLSLQFIGWMDVPPERERENLPAELFPDSDLPRLEEVLSAAAERFHLLTLENAPSDYARTLGAWTDRLNRQRDALTARHGRPLVARHLRAFRRFRLGFEAGSLGLYRAAFRPRRAARS